MHTTMHALRFAGLLAALATSPLPGQTEAASPDPMIGAAKDAAGYMRGMFTRAADQMSEEDYAFRPTPEVRSFGQLLAHVAESNYTFCAAARGEQSPVRDVEKTRTSRAEIQKVLAESFAYCDEAYASLTPARAAAMVQLMRQPRPVLAVLLFRTHHAALHYGNVITYMRLRGKVPPSSQQMPS